MWTEEGIYVVVVMVPHVLRVLSSFHPTSLISFYSSRGQKLCKNVRDLEHVNVSHCVALSDPAIRAISFYCRGLVTLRMSGCPKVHTHTLLKPLNVPWLKSIVFPLVISCHMFSIFFLSASDDRYGSAVSGRWISVPARTWREWLCSSHRSHCPTLREDLSSALLHHDGLLQQHLQVRHKLRGTLQCPESCTITFNDQTVFVPSGWLPWSFSHVWSTGSTAMTTLHTGLNTAWAK